ncbi:hypothetical protein PpBr36_08366 [Pyricularia pennisetigena]|uniref:hypothetical protein n=1 Tax=Pyricularia pennisetigena TaxID=1578925 RepID=UPI00114F8D6A|nr:hypothetical protein PpBr36_08366 [Pyricularia pennisetigena]TLS24105.1 hypothetical protein PpBr36_08366 [Pyricularia pennisetigena]
MTVVTETGFDLNSPVTEDEVLEVRSGKLRSFDGINVMTGIFKTTHDGSVTVTEMGIQGDEHDYTFHGGPDKAIHAYCMSHYQNWKAEFPDAADLFAPGSFGENLVVSRMNERNVCIGDVVSLGPEVVLQVSLPRQPCFKLNHRFRLKNFAPNTWRLSRTGWYYRVLRPGSVRAGDALKLVERKHPSWTIERIQEYLHRNPSDAAMNRELAGIQEFGSEAATAFQSRVAKHESKERKARMAAEEEKQWKEFRVVRKRRETARITSLELEALQPTDEADLKPGAHVKLKLGNGLVRAYSIVGGDRNRFELGVALAEKGKGASKHIHENVHEGDVLTVGRFTNGIPMVSAASNHVFVAAGVGITAFLPMIEEMARINYSVTLHYAVRSADDIPFRERIEKLGKAVVLYDKTKGERLNVGFIVRDLTWNSQLYFCGPSGMMAEALRETQAAGIDEKEVHFEAFEADSSGDPFEATVANKNGGVTLKVGPDETLLEVMQKEFGIEDVPSSCEVGNCGTCKLALKEGRVDHRGSALTKDEKLTSMLSCVSRGIGKIVVEI